MQSFGAAPAARRTTSTACSTRRFACPWTSSVARGPPAIASLPGGVSSRVKGLLGLHMASRDLWAP